MEANFEKEYELMSEEEKQRLDEIFENLKNVENGDKIAEELRIIFAQRAQASREMIANLDVKEEQVEELPEDFYHSSR